MVTASPNDGRTCNGMERSPIPDGTNDVCWVRCRQPATDQIVGPSGTILLCRSHATSCASGEAPAPTGTGEWPWQRPEVKNSAA